MCRLPIDVIPDTDPPRFRWRHMGQDHDGGLPVAVERSVERLITIAKQALADAALLRGQVDGMTERIAEQNETIRQHGDVATLPMSPTAKPINISTGKRKG